MKGGLPASARRLDTGEWVLNLPSAPTDLQEACGWFAVTEVPPPSIPPTMRLNMEVQLVDGRPTMAWTTREETPEERQQRVRHENRLSLRDVQDGLAAIAANEEYLAWYTSPDVQAVMAQPVWEPAVLTQGIRSLAPQVERLTRICNRLIRLELGDTLLDTTESS